MLSFIKYSKDADKLEEIVNSDPGFKSLGRKEIDVLNHCVNANLHMDENEEVLDVCTAMQTLMDRAADKAAEQKRIETLLETVRNLMSNMGLSAEQSMTAMGVAENDRKALSQLL